MTHRTVSRTVRRGRTTSVLPGTTTGVIRGIHRVHRSSERARQEAAETSEESVATLRAIFGPEPAPSPEEAQATHDAIVARASLWSSMGNPS